MQDSLKAAGDSTGIDMRALTQDLAGDREPHHGRSVVEILITVVPLLLLWLSMWFALKLGYGLYLLLAVPAAGFMVRLFMIQHDCGHGAFFRGKHVNDWVGRVLGVFTLTPYDVWRRSHALHHATTFMDSDQYVAATTGEDFREAIKAFLEKREPKFTGR